MLICYIKPGRVIRHYVTCQQDYLVRSITTEKLVRSSLGALFIRPCVSSKPRISGKFNNKIFIFVLPFIRQKWDELIVCIDTKFDQSVTPFHLSGKAYFAILVNKCYLPIKWVWKSFWAHPATIKTWFLTIFEPLYMISFLVFISLLFLFFSKVQRHLADAK